MRYIYIAYKCDFYMKCVIYPHRAYAHACGMCVLCVYALHVTEEVGIGSVMVLETLVFKLLVITHSCKMHSIEWTGIKKEDSFMSEN